MHPAPPPVEPELDEFTPDDTFDAVDHLLPPVTDEAILRIAVAVEEVGEDPAAARRYYTGLTGTA